MFVDARSCVRGHVGLHVYIRQYRTIGVYIDIYIYRRICNCVFVSMHLKFGTFPNQAAHMRSGRGGTHALCAVHGRRIYTTNVKALPESLGKCTLLEILCVPPPPARLRGCGNASAALLCESCGGEDGGKGLPPLS